MRSRSLSSRKSAGPLRSIQPWPNPGADGLPGAYEFQGTGPGRDGRCSPMNQYWGSWGPRVGLAYQLDPRTVLRAAYGLYQTPLKISNFANTDSLGFFAVGYKWPSQVNQQTPAVIPSTGDSLSGIHTADDHANSPERIGRRRWRGERWPGDAPQQAGPAR